MGLEAPDEETFLSTMNLIGAVLLPGERVLAVYPDGTAVYYIRNRATSGDRFGPARFIVSPDDRRYLNSTVRVAVWSPINNPLLNVEFKVGIADLNTETGYTAYGLVGGPS